MKLMPPENICILVGLPKTKEEVKRIAIRLRKGSCVVIKNVYNKKYCRDIVEYLSVIRKSTLPRYEPINNYSPNSYRLNHEDERSSVTGFFEQFNFFAHNQDLMSIYGNFRCLFRLKDRLSSELSSTSIAFNSDNPPCSYISRVGVQFYPNNRGYLAEHTDFVGDNQYVVPTLVLSKRGKDYMKGGFYYKTAEGAIVDPEPFLDVGDIIIFDPSLLHGVSQIISRGSYSWKSSEGRWMAFATTTKVT
jgi:hypothetical protein